MQSCGTVYFSDVSWDLRFFADTATMGLADFVSSMEFLMRIKL